MTAFPGSPIILKGAFIHFDGYSAAPKTIVFPYNPETLSRTISPRAPASPGPQPAASPSGTPLETIVFDLPLDATDQLELSDPQAMASGVYPIMSALELLMYQVSIGSSPLTLFIWGAKRILPVRVVQLQIAERLFDPTLNPIQARVQVTLQVLSDADLTNNPRALSFVQAHLATLSALAGSAYSAGTAQLGISQLISY